MNKTEIENLIEEGVSTKLKEAQKLLSKRHEISEGLLDRRAQISPLTTDVLLRHLDILLDAGKNFLLVSSTIFVTAMALDPSKITNIDIDLLRQISGAGIIVSVLFVVYILFARNLEKNTILVDLRKLEESYSSLVDIKLEILDLTDDKSRAKILEQVKVKLRENELIKSHVPDL